MTDLDKLRALERDATPGPWEAREVDGAADLCTTAPVAEPWLLERLRPEDARLIAALRTCAPELLDYIAAVEEWTCAKGGNDAVCDARDTLHAAIRRATSEREVSDG